jgi:peptidase M42 family hydrolase
LTTGRLPIDTRYLTRQLRRLLTVPSPTGYTDTIVREVCDELTRLDVPFELTRRGAIRAVTEGVSRRPARAIIGHLDTLGCLVKALKPNGRLELVPIGTWSARFAEGARCTVFSDAGGYRGTILPLLASGHTFDARIDTQPSSWEHVELRVDAFARHHQDLDALGIAVGDFVAIDPQPEFLDNGFIVSRHLDNKAGVAVMLAALEAMRREGVTPPVDVFWLLTITEEVGHGASAVVPPEVAAMVTIDNGTTAPGQNSSEFGVTVAMADQTGPFDYHLTHKLIRLCHDQDIRFQRDIFKHYRSDSASALEAGADVRTALITFGVDSSHGYERIHMHALRSLAELVTAYVASSIEITRDARDLASLKGFTTQPMAEAEQDLSRDSEVPEVETG